MYVALVTGYDGVLPFVLVTFCKGVSEAGSEVDIGAESLGTSRLYLAVGAVRVVVVGEATATGNLVSGPPELRSLR